MFHAQGLIYRTYRGTTFRALLQTSSRHQKQTRQQLAKHFHGHNINDNLNVTILQNNIKIADTRRYHEQHKWICKLKTFSPHGLNTEIGGYAKEMYNFY